MPPVKTKSRPSRSWLQFRFSLALLIFAVTLFCIWLADWVDPIRKLVRRLASNEVSVRVDAAFELGRLGRSAKAAEPYLVSALSDTDQNVRCTAAWALSRVGGDLKPLWRHLSDQDGAMRLAVAEAILWRGGDAGAVIPTLLELEGLDDSSMQVSDLLRALSPRSASMAIPALLQALTSEDDTIRDTADYWLYGVGRYGIPMPSTDVIEILVKHLRHDHPGFFWICCGSPRIVAGGIRPCKLKISMGRFWVLSCRGQLQMCVSTKRTRSFM